MWNFFDNPSGNFWRLGKSEKKKSVFSTVFSNDVNCDVCEKISESAIKYANIRKARNNIKFICFD